VLLTS